MANIEVFEEWFEEEDEMEGDLDDVLEAISRLKELGFISGINTSPERISDLVLGESID